MEEFTEQEIRRVLAGFDGVWCRVTGQPPEERAQADGSGDPAGFLRREAQAAGQDAALARCFQGAPRAALLAHAGKARRRAARLRGEHFLLTGESCVPVAAASPLAAGSLIALRAALIRDREMARDYRAAAKKADDDALRAMYARFAAEQETAAGELRRIVLQCF